MRCNTFNFVYHALAWCRLPLSCTIDINGIRCDWLCPKFSTGLNHGFWPYENFVLIQLSSCYLIIYEFSHDYIPGVSSRINSEPKTSQCYGIRPSMKTAVKWRNRRVDFRCYGAGEARRHIVLICPFIQAFRNKLAANIHLYEGVTADGYPPSKVLPWP